jgi:hypothetical protein
MDGIRDSSRASPFLEEALLLSLVAHAMAMASMILLLPGLPGGLKCLGADAAALAESDPMQLAHLWLRSRDRQAS